MRVKSCAGCVSLIHLRTGGFICSESYPSGPADEVFDKKHDQYVSQKPMLNGCKSRTLMEQVKKSTEKSRINNII